MSLKEKIIAQEKSLLTYRVRESVSDLKSLLSTEFKEVGASGTCSVLSDVLNNLPKEQDWSCKTQDWEFRKLSDDVVQTFHRAFVIHLGKDKGEYSMRTSIWKNENGIWKMIYHQGTRTAPFKIEN